MAAATILAVLVLLGILATVCLLGCRQMPVLRGQYAEDQVAQARVDSRQADRIADICALEEGMGTVLTVVAPEEVKPQAKAVQTKVVAVKAKADAEAAQGRERAALAERDLQTVNAAPGAGAWLSAGLGALSGNWSGLLDLVMGTLGLGGAAAAFRERRNSRKALAEVVDGVDGFMAAEPAKAEALKTHLSRSMDRKTKDKIRAVKARRMA